MPVPDAHQLGDAVRHWGSVVAHVDLDAFFAQAEELDDPAIRGLPVIVGPPPPVFREDGTVDTARSGRGIVCTSNYAARAMGVRTAMPSSRAHRLCPHGVYRKPRGERYRELSRAVFEACAALTPVVRRVGIDEGYLGLTGLEKWLGLLVGDDGDDDERASLELGTFAGDWPLFLARRVVRRVKNETGLDVSIGVGPNRYIAKLASDYDKPRGCSVVRPGLCADFVSSLPLRDLRGVGPATEARLNRVGITASAQLVRPARDEVVRLAGDLGAKIHDLASGQDGDVPRGRDQRKSVSRDTTFGDDVRLDTAGRERLLATCAQLLERATYTVRGEALFARTVGVRLRFADFSEVQHERSLVKGGGGVIATDQDAELLPVVRLLLDEAIDERASGAQRALGVRLVGVKLSGLTTSAERQLTLGDDGSDAARRAELYRAADAIRAKMGAGAVVSARALAGGRKRQLGERGGSRGRDVDRTSDDGRV